MAVAGKSNNPFITEFNERLTELERKIEEENYNPSVDSFEDEFYLLKEDAQNLYDECIDKGETSIVEGFIKRLNVIRDEHNLYNEDAELDRMFPNRTDKSDPDGEWESGFSADKFLGLDD
jgi:hypothetical protein